MAKLGVLFSIEAQGGGTYGYRAYKILLDILDRMLLFECELSDGDVGANWEYYCIAIESSNLSRLHEIKSIVFRSNSTGLANFEDAVTHIEKAVTIRPNYAEAWASTDFWTDRL